MNYIYVYRRCGHCIKFAPEFVEASEILKTFASSVTLLQVRMLWFLPRDARRQRCSSVTLDSGNIRFMQIFMEVPWRGGVKQQWGTRKRGFSGLSDATSSAP